MLNRIVNAITDRILNRLQPIIETQLDDWRAEALTMISEALPDMAAAIAEQAVKTVFEHTEIDEAADAVSGVIQRITQRLPRIPILPWEHR